MKEKFMNVAVKESLKALKCGEMPVGAVIVYNNKILSKAYNKKEKNKNSLMHAEIIAINKACKKIGDWRLNECTMYVTMEPCYMCIGAIVESRIKTVYCGIKNIKSHNINKKIVEKEKINVIYGLLEIQIKIIINKFFKSIRTQTNVRKLFPGK